MKASNLANGTISLKSVLLATDFSNASMQALPYAKAIAQRFNAKLFTGHVVPPDDYPSGLNSSEEAAQLASREAELKINDLLNSGPCHDLSCVGLVSTGDIWVGLSDFIRKYSIDLLVMGTVGRTGITKFLLGSIAEEAMRESRCPVLTVGPQSHRAEDIEFRQILYATDFSADSLVFNQADFVAEPEIIVEMGSPAEVVLKAAHDVTADLIIIGAHGAGGLPRVASHFGSIAHKIVCRAVCPVLTVRPLTRG
jgi:nucleotide-binding universal stress UspA family protein